MLYPVSFEDVVRLRGWEWRAYAKTTKTCSFNCPVMPTLGIINFMTFIIGWGIRWYFVRLRIFVLLCVFLFSGSSWAFPFCQLWASLMVSLLHGWRYWWNLLSGAHCFHYISLIWQVFEIFPIVVSQFGHIRDAGVCELCAEIEVREWKGSGFTNVQNFWFLLMGIHIKPFTAAFIRDLEYRQLIHYRPQKRLIVNWRIMDMCVCCPTARLSHLQ